MGAAYLVVAWLVVQLVVTVTPILDAPACIWTPPCSREISFQIKDTYVYSAFNWKPYLPALNVRELQFQKGSKGKKKDFMGWMPGYGQKAELNRAFFLYSFSPLSASGCSAAVSSDPFFPSRSTVCISRSLPMNSRLSSKSLDTFP